MSYNKNNKSSQEAKNLFPCVDLKFEGNATVIKPKQTRRGRLTYVQRDEKFLFREGDAPITPQPQLHWRLLDRTKHGRIHINSRHVKVEFYIHHDDYENGRQLADILASEIETMGESLSDMCLAEEVEKCC